MPTFLSDPPPAVYFVLVGAVIVLGLVWLNKRDRRSLVAFGIAVAVLLVVALIDKAVESPREESVRKVQQMANAATAHNQDAFVAEIADTVEYSGGGQPVKLTKEQIRHSGFWQTLQQFSVRVAVWDFSREDVKQIDDNTVEIGFLGKGEVPDGKQFPVYVRATFARQPDGKMRLTKFATFDPMSHDKPLPIPNFP